MKLLKYLLFSFTLLACKGTINTTSFIPPSNKVNYKKAYIISAEDSQYIKFRFGLLIIPFAYIPLPDKEPNTTEVIGNTAEVIQMELQKHNILAVIGKRGDNPEGYDFIVEYHDVWRWDFKKILDHLDIAFISSSGDSLLAYSSYDIYVNKEYHNFPSPEKEVPKMLIEMLGEK